jgi:hypothetical protein
VDECKNCYSKSSKSLSFTDCETITKTIIPPGNIAATQVADTVKIKKIPYITRFGFIQFK